MALVALIASLNAFVPPTRALAFRTTTCTMGLFDGFFGGAGASSVPAGFCQASHILLIGEDAVERAEALKSRVAAGELSFADAAKEFSECPSKGKGGDLGVFNSLSRVAFLPYVENQDVSAFDAVVFAPETAIGEPVVVTTAVGSHVVMVEARN